MLRLRRLCTPSLAALAICFAPAVAFATPTDVVNDYNDNGVLDARHSTKDLSAALAFIQTRQEASYSAFEDVIIEAREEGLLGLHRERSSSTPPQVPVVPRKGRISSNERTPTPAVTKKLSDNELPGVFPPATATLSGVAGDGLPWPFVGLSILAGLLVMAGAGSTAIRRADRRT